MYRYLKRLLIGQPLKTAEESGQSLTKFKALALLSSDALSSVAYGTEQITTALFILSPGMHYQLLGSCYSCYLRSRCRIVRSSMLILLEAELM